MRVKLDEAREHYKREYVLFIQELERKAKEVHTLLMVQALIRFVQIMEIYEQLIEARTSKNPEYRLQMLELENRRNYDKRISDLSADLRNIELKSKNLRDMLNVLGNQYNPQVQS